MGLLIPCSEELVGSNPTPRAYLGGLYKINKNKVNKDSSKRKTDLVHRQQISNQEEEEEKKKETDLLYRKINFITKTCSKLYFNKILKKLVEKNSENANIICGYIIAEETELNIKNSQKKVE